MRIRRRALAALSLTLSLAFQPVPSRAEDRQLPQGRGDVMLSFAPVARRVAPAVVNVYASRVEKRPRNSLLDDPIFRQFFGGGGERPGNPSAQSLGSGVVVDASGLVVTNYHVIEDMTEVRVALSDKREYPADIVLRDVRTDLAVLRLKGARDLPVMELGDSDALEVGDIVLAVGDPFGVGQTVTQGIVSGLARSQVGKSDYQYFVQTDAAINPGNSGGALVDMRSRLIGINSAIYSQSGGSVGIGFAIPAEEAKPVVDVLMKGGRVKRGYLGVGIQPMTDDIASALGLPKNIGEIVGRVEPGYPAARAGIQQGDVIVKVNGQDVTLDNSLSFIVANLPIGSKVPIELYRRGQKVSVVAIVGERPPEEQLAGQLGGDSDGDNGTPDQAPSAQTQATRATLGVTLQALTPQIAQQLGVPATVRGVVIASVDPSSDAGSNGLKRGDVILSINQQPTLTVAAAAQIIADAKKAGRDTVLLLVARGTQQAIYIGVKLVKK